MENIATNRKAYHDYYILSTYEAGIVLVGQEVKSIRAGNVNLKDSFILINSEKEVFVKNMYVKTYDKTTSFAVDERRDRKLLLKKSEINKLCDKVREKGLTLVPLKMYFSGKNVKVEIGLVKGKHTYDKKETLKLKDAEREMKRDIKNYSRLA